MSFIVEPKPVITDAGGRDPWTGPARQVDPRYLGPPIPVDYAPGYWTPPVRCAGFQCGHYGGCYPDARGNFSPDCMRSLYPNGMPYGNDMVLGPAPGPAKDNGDAGGLAEMFSGMSTTTLLLIGAAAYFLFFRKGR